MLLDENLKEKLSEFIIAEEKYLRSGKVLMFAVADEVNDVCISGSVIDSVAKYIKSFNLEIPVAAVYDMSDLGARMGKAMPLPEFSPEM